MKKKSLLKALIFILLFVFLFWGYMRTFTFKTSDGPYQMMKFYDEKDNSLDVIFLGSSHMFVNANIPILWDEYGIASYNLGGSIQPIWNSYYRVVEALKTQNPKAIVIDVATVPFYNELDFGSYENVIKNVYGMKLSRNKLEAIDASVKEGDRECYYYEYPTFHKRYTDVTEDDFIFDYKNDYRDKNCWKGQKIFFVAPNEMPKPTDDILLDDSIGELSEKNEKYIRLLIDLCKNNGIELVFTLNPYCVAEGDMSILNKVEEIASESGVRYVNYNLLYDDIGMDFNKDFSDDCHMVYYGSEKFTRFMADTLLSELNIPDRRGQEGYESFDEMAQMYRQVVSEKQKEE